MSLPSFTNLSLDVFFPNTSGLNLSLVSRIGFQWIGNNTFPPKKFSSIVFLVGNILLLTRFKYFF